MSDEPAFSFSLPAHLDQVGRLTSWLRSITSTHLREDEFILLEIGIVEIVNNIIEHGFGQTPPGILDVTCELKGSQVTLRIIDTGEAIPDGLQERYDNLSEEASLDATSGRGLGIIKKCFKRVVFQHMGGHNNVTAVYDLDMVRA
ncbi:ATP-binding protein [Niveispirillum sp. KHB5.9]|uniref:ATP-binding protein n=1 Tax=Niveispirillum sp. KHB5.9 TaxID=3400269 RepID=UPI003A8A17CC